MQAGWSTCCVQAPSFFARAYLQVLGLSETRTPAWSKATRARAKGPNLAPCCGDGPCSWCGDAWRHGRLWQSRADCKAGRHGQVCKALPFALL